MVYFYNTAAGLTDATAFQSRLAANPGIWAALYPYTQIDTLDLSHFRAIIMGDDTADIKGVTYLSAAEVQKIRQSAKPVVGIGFGGVGLFSALGLYLTPANSSSMTTQTGVAPMATENPAWTTPNSISTAANVTLYTTPILTTSVYRGFSNYPWQSITQIDTEIGSLYSSPILSQKANGTCYTLWGFHSNPTYLTMAGQQLFGNLVWQPNCMPAVVYVGGSDTTLRDSVDTLLNNAGFPARNTLASTLSTFDFSPYQEILVGWDTTTDWGNASNVNAVKRSHLPVLGMGFGGFALYLWYILPSPQVIGGGSPTNLQKSASLVNPLQAAMRSPYPVLVHSDLAPLMDSTAGVMEYYHNYNSLPQGTTSMGTWLNQPTFQTFYTESYNGIGYSLWGLQGYPSNMTYVAKNLFRNMLVTPRSSFFVNLPLVKK